MSMNHPGDERRAPQAFPRWAMFTLMALAYLAVMGPLGALVLSARNTGERADRNSQSVCELAVSNAHLARTLDAGLALILADEETKDEARAQLVAIVAEGQTITDTQAETCRTP